MTTCAKCGAAGASMFLDDGSAACRACFYAADTFKKEDTSSKQAITGGYASLAIGVLGVLFCVLIGAKRLAVVPALFLAGGFAAIRHGKQTQRRLRAQRDSP
ncbi:MAG: hypothetical protein HOV80_08235 [Polyangiaceae bacterium]|nr:hypothetical protein [Polyangiaceae bacterium]